MKNIFLDVFRLFIPRVCPICGRRLNQAEELICSYCMTSLPRAHNFEIPNNEMEKNLWGKLNVVRAGAWLWYSSHNSAKSLIHNLKYYNDKASGCIIGRYMANEALKVGFFQDIDFIVPVPLHPAKRKKRGYNQSEEIAKGISQVTGIPVRTDIILRKENTPTQTKLMQYQRWDNMCDRFMPGCGAADACGRHILLVDDVFTTGATTVSAAESLKNIENTRYSIMAVATSRRNR